MIKSVFIDFDGTLFDHSKECVHESTVKALNKAHEKGVKVFLCSGRLLDEMKLFDLSRIPFDGFILGNGSLICDADYKVIKSFPITGEADGKLRDLFNRKIFSLVIFDKEGSYVNVNTDFTRNVLKTVNTPLKEELPLRDNPILSATAYFGSEDNLKYLREIEDDIYHFFWYELTANILDKNVNKLTGIKEVISDLDMPLCYTMAIGDGSNDIPMLKECGYGVAMGQASDETKENADYVTDDVSHDGIYNALKHYGVIDD